MMIVGTLSHEILSSTHCRTKSCLFIFIHLSFIFQFNRSHNVFMLYSKSLLSSLRIESRLHPEHRKYKRIQTEDIDSLS